MANKTYSIRVPQTVEVESEQLAEWLDEALSSGTASLAADPGAGAKTLRVSLDEEKVSAGAKAAGDSDAVFLRRLIASRVRIAEEKQTEKPRPKPAVLPRNLRIEAQQLTPVITALDHAQTFLLSRVTRSPEARQAARMTDAERADISRASVEVINRRAPAWVVEHIDLLGAVGTIAAVEGAVISRAYEALEKRRKRAEQQTQQAAVQFPASAEMPGVEGMGDESSQ